MINLQQIVLPKHTTSKMDNKEITMKQGRKVSAIAVGLALAGITSLSPVHAQQADEEAANLERIAVTGSRIKRTDMEGPSPIQSIDATMIEGMGYENLQQLYRFEVWGQMQR